jgi:glutamate-ammonia-ligase adenylyltransferase
LEQALVLLARHVPPDHRSGLQILLSQCPDPETVLRRLESFCLTHPAEFQQVAYSPFGLQALVAVFSHSAFLSEELARHPGWLVELLGSGHLHHVRQPEELAAALDERLGLPGGPLPAVELALFRRREILRILLRDVLGFAALSEVAEELTNLADCIIDAAFSRLRAELAARYGEPELETGGRCGFSVIALGKLGGRELNYSSDIDLLFLYDGPGETSGAQPVSNKEFYKKLSNQLTDVLGTHTVEGLCYRVDLRLRPDGKLGEVCISRAGAETYYSGRARDWELQMLIKARVAAGDSAPGRPFLDWVQPQIYSTTLDFSAIESVSQARFRISEKLAQRRRAPGIDVKLARGGIRDIEFLAQCLQRLHGGVKTWLRSPSTLQTLVRLRDKDLLSDIEYSRLASAYQFLRHLEHRLQFDCDLQTHLLPEESEALGLYARRMPPGLLGESATPEALLARLNAHLEKVQSIYERVIHAQQPMYYSLSPAAPPPQGLAANEAATLEPAPANLVRFLDQKAPALAAFLARTPPRRGRTGFEHFLDRVIAHPEWLAALDQDTVLAGYLVDLFENAPYLAEQLVRSPDLFSELRGLRADLKTDVTVVDLIPLLDDAGEIRRLFRREMFRLLAASVCLRPPIFDTLKQTSLLADAAVRACYRLAITLTARRHPPADPDYRPEDQLLVITLGRLGMLEFDLGSDADLVFVLPDEDFPEHAFWTRVAEKLIEILSSYTGDGTIFAVDTRLSPNGTAAARVQSTSTVAEYFARQAEAWEGIAYMKSRPVAGNLARGSEFLRELQRIDWRRYGQNRRSRRDLRQMRLRVEREHGAANPLKAGPGGYYDIDFALMYFRLRGAGMFFEVLNTPLRIKVVEEMGHLDSADARFLLDASTFYRALDHGLRLIGGHSAGTLPSAEVPLQILTELVSRWTIEHLHDQPLALELEQIQARTREFFDRVFGADEEAG